MKLKRAAALAVAGAALALMLTGCGPAIVRVEDPARTDAPAVDLGAAKALDAELRIGVGTLRVSGGTGRAMEARFDYRPESWKPGVRYSVEGTTGELLVEQPQPQCAFGNGRNEWDVRLNDSVPLTLSVKTGVGKSTLDLGDLRLRRLDVVGGVGETTVDLGRVAREDVTVDIRGGVGLIVVRVPRGAAVRLGGDPEGIGEFRARGFTRSSSENALVNESYGTPGAKRYDIRVQRGIGDVIVEQQ